MSTSLDTQDAPSSADRSTSNQQDLLEQMLDAFWCLENNSKTMTSKYRMVAVAKLLADTIRSWAPDPGQAKICHLAITEVADRLIRETTPKAQ